MQLSHTYIYCHPSSLINMVLIGYTYKYLNIFKDKIHFYAKCIRSLSVRIMYTLKEKHAKIQ